MVSGVFHSQKDANGVWHDSQAATNTLWHEPSPRRMLTASGMSHPQIVARDGGIIHRQQLTPSGIILRQLLMVSGVFHPQKATHTLWHYQSPEGCSRYLA